MALDMIGQVTGMDLFLVERQARKAVDRTAQNYEAVIDQWESHSKDLKRKLCLEKCHSAGLTAQHRLLKKLVQENNGSAAFVLTSTAGEDGARLTLSHLAYFEAYNAKAQELKLPTYRLTKV